MGIMRGEAATGGFKGIDTADTTVIDGSAGTASVPDAALLMHGQYVRLGPDLMIVGPDGQKVLVTDYFTHETPPDLMGPSGMMIHGTTATALAGPRAPGQVAQAEGAAGDVELAQAAQAIGTVTRLTGTVFVQRADGTRVELSSGDQVFQGDIVETGGDGAIGITFADGTEMSLGAEGRLVLDEMIYDPDSGTGQSSFSLVSGAFSFVSGQIAKAGPDAMQVKTPVATIGIRGTKGVIKVGAFDTDGDGEADSQIEVALLDSGEIVIRSFNGVTQTLNQINTGFRIVQFSGSDMLIGSAQDARVETFQVTREFFNDSAVRGAITHLPAGTAPNLDAIPPQAPQVAPPVQETTPAQQTLLEQAVRVVLANNDLREAAGLPQLPVGTSTGQSALPPQTQTGTAPVVVTQPGTGGTQTGGGTASGQGPTGTSNNTPIVAPPPTNTSGPRFEPADPQYPGYTPVRLVGGTVDFSASTAPLLVWGSTAADIVTTGIGNDIIHAGAGNDSIYTGAGNDYVYAGAGADTVVAGSGNGDDVYFGGDEDGDDSADDLLIYTSATEGVYVDLYFHFAFGPQIGSDYVSGFEHVRSGSGDDMLVGDEAANRLEAGDGDDSLSGGGGNDTLMGGAGSDEYAYLSESGAWDDDIIDDAGGDADYLDFTLAEGAEPDTIRAVGTDLVISVVGHGTITIRNYLTTGRIEYIRTVDGDLELVTGTTTGTAADEVLFGGDGAETITGGDGSDALFGNGGNDVLDGGAGDDFMAGGDGNDTYTFDGAQFGRDDISDTSGVNRIALTNATLSSAEATAEGMVLHVGAENSIDVFGTISDIVVDGTVYTVRSGTDGEATNDLVLGTSGDDHLSGGDGADIVAGGSGHDTLTGGDASGDLLLGGDGNDVYVFEAGAIGNDTIHDTAGYDRIELRGTEFALAMRDGDDLVLVTSTEETITIRDHFAGTGAGVEIADMNGLSFTLYGGVAGLGTEGHDIMAAAPQGEALQGFGGFDLILGNVGDDSLYGGAGYDLLLGSHGNDYLSGGDDDDIMSGGSGDDTFDGGAGRDVVSFADATDSVIVNLGSSAIYLHGDSIGGHTARDGQGGTDVLYSVEVVHGGDFDDTLIGSGADESFAGLGGNDLIVGDDGWDRADYSFAANGIVVNLSENDIDVDGETVAAGTALDGSGGTDTLTGIEEILGSAGDDLIIGPGTGAALLIGGHGDDTLDGGSDLVDEREVLVGYGEASSGIIANLGEFDYDDGEVVVKAGTVLDGDGGTDIVTNVDGVDGSAFADLMIGGSSDEIFRGNEGADTLYGGAGLDTADYSRDVDSVIVNLSDADVTIAGFAAAAGTADDGWGDTDTLIDIENVRGSEHADILIGSATGSILLGGGGDDILQGGAGADILAGGAGDDLILGGGGEDVFIAESGMGNDTIEGGAEQSVIHALGMTVYGATFDSATGAAWIDFGDGNTLTVLNSANVVFTDGTSIRTLPELAAVNYDETITGTAGDDELYGSDYNSTIFGGDGDDMLSGAGGADLLEGGDGDDSLYGGTGDDTLRAGSGSDILRGDEGDDVLEGDGQGDQAHYQSATGSVIVNLSSEAVTVGGVVVAAGTAHDGLGGVDTLSGIHAIGGSGNNDTLIGNDDTNVLVGNNGDDLIEGRGGNDTLSGGFGNDTIDGGDGNDMLVLLNENMAGLDPVVVNLSDAAVSTSVGEVAAHTLRDAGGGIDVLAGIEGVFGSNGVDSIFGGSGNESLFGGYGDDLVSGGGGSDILVGEDGNDRLEGGDGDDALDGSAGNDTLDGGAGLDFLNYSQSRTGQGVIVNFGASAITVNGITVAGGTAIDDHGDTDTFVNVEEVSGTNVADTLMGGAGNDGFMGNGGADIIDGGAGHDVAYYWESAATETGAVVNLSDAAVTVDGVAVAAHTAIDTTGAIDSIVNIEELDGGAFADTFIGGDGAETLKGNGGDDSLAGGGGSDLLLGGIGNDTLDGGAGDDTLDGGAGDDRMATGGGTDTVLLAAGMGRDTVTTTGSGAVTLTWAADLTMAALSYDSANDTAYFDFGNGDTLTLIGTANVTVSSGGVLTAVSDMIDVSAGEVIVGTDGDDTLTGGDRADSILGGLGNDSLIGGDGNDTLDGGDGYDVLTGGAGNDVLIGGGDLNTADFTGATGSVVVNMGAGAITVGGSTVAAGTALDGLGGTDTLSGIQRILGGAQNDTLVGGTGNDSLIGNGGDDSLAGGDGYDVLEGGAGSDTLDGGAGMDVVVMRQHGVAQTGVVVNLTGTAVSTAIGTVAAGTASDGSEVDVLIGIEGAVGTDGNDSLYGSNGNTMLHGLEGDDLLVGGQGLDQLNGGAGDDSLSAGGGDDNLSGGEGNDTLDGGAGIDNASFFLTPDEEAGTGLTGAIVNLSGAAVTVGGAVVAAGTARDSFGTTDTLVSIEQVSGSQLGDTIIGGDGSETLWGNEGDDLLDDAGLGNDVIYGGDGSDTVIAGAGDDGYYDWSSVSTTGAGGDWIDFRRATAVSVDLSYGSAYDAGTGYDYLYGFENVIGSAGNDTLAGNFDANILQGGAGDDILTDHGGDDTLEGGIGSDTYAYIGYEGPWGSDVISDAGGTGDVLDLGLSLLEAGDVRLDGADLVMAMPTSGTITLRDFTTTGGIEVFRLAGGDLTPTVGTAGTDANDLLIGGDGDETLTGGAGFDWLSGNGGNDVLNGGTGTEADLLAGGAGNDTYTFITSVSGGFGHDTLSDTAGTDRIVIDAEVRDFQLSGAGLLMVVNDTSSVRVFGGIEELEAAGALYQVRQAADGEGDSGGADLLLGTGGDDSLDGGAGADFVAGGEGADTLTGGDSAADTLAGGMDDDTYIFTSGSIGDDVVVDTGGVDRAVLVGTTLAGLQQVGDDLVLATGSGETITLRGHYLYGGAIETLAIGGVDYTLAHYGSGSNENDIVAPGYATYNYLSGYAGDDILFGSDGQDTLDGGLGSDTMLGGLGNDVYQIHDVLADDADIIDDAGGIDTLSFYYGTAPTTVSATAQGLLFSFGTATVATTGIDAVWTESGQLLQTSATGIQTAGNDLAFGTDGNDTIAMTEGQDAIYGNGGDDTYVLAAGMGHDTIVDVAGSNVVDGSAVTISGGHYDSVTGALRLDMADSYYHSVTLRGDLSTFSYDDGSRSWAFTTAPTGTAGHDFLVSGDTDDTLTGGAGDDILLGSGGNDVYAFVAGAIGHDTIMDSAGTDSISLTGTGVAFFGMVGMNAVLTTDEGETITLGNGTYYSYYQYIEAVVSGGVSRGLYINYGGDTDDLVGTADSGYGYLSGGAGNDILFGNDLGSQFSGDTGDDTLRGGVGNDTYTFQATDAAGADVIHDAGGTDSISFASATDLIGIRDTAGGMVFERADGGTITVATGAVESLSISYGYALGLTTVAAQTTGNDAAYGTDADETIVLSAGNDAVFGNGGADTYVLSAGMGLDTVIDSGGDTLLDGSAVTLVGAALDTSGLLRFTFDGYQSIYVNAAGPLAYTDGSRTWTVTSSTTGTSGLDLMVGSNGADTLTGSLGDDYLNGSDGDDVYELVGGAFGHDTITDSNGTDSIVLTGASLTDADFLNGELVLRTDTGESVTVRSGYHYYSASPVETLVVDGVTWNLAIGYGGTGNDIVVSDGWTLSGGDGNDLLYGADTGASLNGDGGDDTLLGGSGDDTYSFQATSASGNDIIRDAGGNDVISFASATAPTAIVQTTDGLVFRHSGGATVTVASGTIEMLSNGQGFSGTVVAATAQTTGGEAAYGTDGNDTITLSAGNDVLYGNDGDDTYVLSESMGHDTIVDGVGTIVLDGSAVTLADGQYDSTTNSLRLTTAGNQSVTIKNPAAVSFDDGSTAWSIITGGTGTDGGDMLIGTTSAEAMDGGLGNDLLIGGEGDDTLDGGTGGNDTLLGGAGSNVYAFTGGSIGQDVVHDIAGNGTLAFTGTTIATLAHVGDDLVVTTTGGETVTVVDHFAGAPIAAISIDGTVYGVRGGSGTAADEFVVSQFNGSSNTLYGYSGNDSLFGSDVGDTFFAGGGSDLMHGGSGNDHYNLYSDVLQAGEADVIRDAGGTDTISFGASNVLEGVVASGGALVFTTATGGTLTADLGAIEAVNLGSGNLTLVAADSQTTGDDAAFGTDGNDTITLSAGNDHVFGNGGDDTYLVASGAGSDTVVTGTGADTLSAAGLVLDRVDQDTATGGLHFAFDGGDNVLVRGPAGLTYTDGTSTFAVVTGDTGTSGADIVVGGDAAETLSGGSGGDDLLFGGTGNDVYTFVGGAIGHDTVCDTSGIDGITLTGADVLSAARVADDLRLSLDTGESITIAEFFSFRPVETITINGTSYALASGFGSAAADLVVATYPGNSISGVNGDDLLIGDADGNAFSGGTGNDTIRAGSGNDSFAFYDSTDIGTETIVDGGGIDTIGLIGSAKPVGMVSDPGTGVLTITDIGGGTITATGTFEVLWTSSLAFSIVSAAGQTTGADAVIGTTGADTIALSEGTDLVYANGGGDTLVLSNGMSGDTVYGAGGVTLVAGGMNLTSAGYDAAAGTLSFAFEAVDAVTLHDWTGATYYDGVRTFSLVAPAAGSAVSADADMVIGGSGAETLAGGGGDDWLLAGGGNDTLTGDAGNDTLDGGTGNDLYQLTGGTIGSDVIRDSTGTDTLSLTGAAITSAQKSGDDMVLGTDTGETITLDAHYSSIVIETVVMGGTTYTLGSYGTAGDDILVATTTSGILSSGDGNDIIFGSSTGNHTFQGGNGNDTLVGGAGNDVYDFSIASQVGSETVRDSGGTDTISFAGTSSPVTMIAAAGVTTVTLATGGTIAITGTIEVLRDQNGTDLAIVDAAAQTTGGDAVLGTTGNDTINLSAGNDLIFGNGGTDTFGLTAGMGHDTVLGAGGAILSGSGMTLTEAVYDAASGALKLDFGTAASVTLNDWAGATFNDGVATWTMGAPAAGVSASGSNVITAGTSGADSLTGGSGLDWLFGGAGNDTLTATSGGDHLFGGDGDDVYALTAGAIGSLVISDASGADSITLTGTTVASASRSGNDLVIATASSETITIANHFAAGAMESISAAGADYYISATYGATFDDLVVAANTAGGNHLSGYGGNDLLFGTDNGDTLWGGAGNDTAKGGTGNDIYLFQAESEVGSDLIEDAGGSDTISFGGGGTMPLSIAATGGNLVFGFAGGQITASGGIETLLSDTGASFTLTAAGTQTAGQNAVIHGSAGDDTITLDDGNDWIYGNDGNDAYNLGTGMGADTIVNSAGADTVYASDLTLVSALYDSARSQIDLDFGSEGTVTVRNSGTMTVQTTAGAFGLLGNVDGSIGDDLIAGSTGDDRLDALSGNDILFGGAGNDTLLGRAGSDTLDGGFGNDSLVGGTEDDVLIGGIGDDTLLGSSGNDTLDGGDGNDVIFWHGAGSIVGGTGLDFIGLRASVLANDTVHAIADFGGYSTWGVEGFLLNDEGASRFDVLSADFDSVIGSAGSLYIRGDADDTVSVAAVDGWTYAGRTTALDGIAYDHFSRNAGGQHLYVQAGVTLENISLPTGPVWLSDKNGNWSDSANWAAVPVNNDAVSLSTAVTVSYDTISADGQPTLTLASLAMVGGSTLQLLDNTALSVAYISGADTVNGGTSVVLAGGALTTTDTWNTSHVGSFSMSGDSVLNAESTISTSSLTWSGGTFQSGYINLEGTGAISGTTALGGYIDLRSGTLTLAGDLTGTTSSVISSYQGTISVTGGTSTIGTLRAVGGDGFPDVVIQSGSGGTTSLSVTEQTTAITMTVDAGAGAVNLTLGGTGPNEIGTLTVQEATGTTTLNVAADLYIGSADINDSMTVNLSGGAGLYLGAPTDGYYSPGSFGSWATTPPTVSVAGGILNIQSGIYISGVTFDVASGTVGLFENDMAGSFDTSYFAGGLDNIGTLNLNLGQAGDTLLIGTSDILDMLDGGTSLTIEGDATDTFTLLSPGDWTAETPSGGYAIYSTTDGNGQTVTLQIDSDIQAFSG